MARIVKEAEVRREELLDLALRLFLDAGYERTSVERVTTEAGLAKGTFYHYFASKQDLLEQLVERFTDGLFEEIETALAEVEGGSAIDRFRALTAASTRAKLGRKDVTLALSRSLFSDGNQALRSHLVDGWIERTRPFIGDIIEQGCAEGVFDVPDPQAMTEVWLSIWYDHGMNIAELFFAAQDDPSRVDELVSAMNTLVLAEERILGAAPGTLGIEVEDAVHGVLIDPAEG